MKRYGRRKFFRRKVRKVKKTSFAKKVLRVVQKRAEHKFSAGTYAGASIDYTGTLYRITDIVQGDSDVQRNGDVIQPVRLRMNMHLVAGDTINLMRCIVFRWKPFTGSLTPSTSDILASVSTVNAPLSMLVHDTRNQFTLLYDKTFRLSTVTHDSALQHVDLSGSKVKKIIQYNSDSTTNQTGAIYVMFISDSGAASHPTVSWYYRLDYVDY